MRILTRNKGKFVYFGLGTIFITSLVLFFDIEKGYQYRDRTSAGVDLVTNMKSSISINENDDADVVEHRSDAIQKPVVHSSSSFLQLLALFETHDQELASAVILIDDIGAYRYQVGEMLGDDIILAAILPDRVLLRRDDETIQVLKLIPLGSREGADAPVTPDQVPDQVQELGVSEAEKKKMEFLARIDLHPVSKGLPNGYIVGDKVPEQVTQHTEIRAGDIIVSLNGYPVGEHNNDYLAWDSYQATQRATMVVRRGSEEFVISYP